MRTQQQDTPARTRTITGTVTGAAVISYGTGFVVTTTATGVYVLRFRPRLRAVLSLVVTLQNGGFWIVNNANVPGGDDFTINTYSTAAAAQNQPFTFTATGIAA